MIGGVDVDAAVRRFLGFRLGDLTGTTITTSICPKTLEDAGSDAGYGPNVSALLRGLKSVLVP